MECHGPPRPIMRGPRTHATGISTPEIALFVADAIPKPGTPSRSQGGSSYRHTGHTENTPRTVAHGALPRVHGSTTHTHQLRWHGTHHLRWHGAHHGREVVANTHHLRWHGTHHLWWHGAQHFPGLMPWHRRQRDNVAETPLPRDIVAHNPSSGAWLDDAHHFPRWMPWHRRQSVYLREFIVRRRTTWYVEEDFIEFIAQRHTTLHRVHRSRTHTNFVGMAHNPS